jgi:hypothetical protein
MTVKIFKMINGEVMMGDVTDVNPEYYIVTEPASVMLQERDGGVGVGIAPYMPYAEGKISIRTTAIAAEGDPDQKLVNEYNRLFGSGIVIANVIPK